MHLPDAHRAIRAENPLHNSPPRDQHTIAELPLAHPITVGEQVVTL